MKITEGQYLDALKTVREYVKQIQDEMNITEVYEKDEFLDCFVLDSDLSVRCVNSIHDMGNHLDNFRAYDLTFRELNKIGKKLYKKIPGVGRKTIEEIEAIFENNGHKFK